MKLILKEKKQELPDVTTFIFEPEKPIHWEAGQFMHYKLPHEHPDLRKDERWFTISSAPFDGHIQITTRHADKPSSFKTALFALEPGAAIEADGPEGDFVTAEDEERRIFIAGGIGITPFRSILLDLDHKKRPIKARLLYANRDEKFVFKEELDALAGKHDDFSINYIIEPERINEELIRKEVPNLSEPTFYISGPEPMVEIFEKMLGKMGVPEDHMKRDYFPGYEWAI